MDVRLVGRKSFAGSLLERGRLFGIVERKPRGALKCGIFLFGKSRFGRVPRVACFFDLIHSG